jgi:RNA polymerase sigma-70 factor (ECF subfamily)
MSSERPDAEELLRRASQGERAAWGPLLELHRERLRRMIALRLDRRLTRRVDPSDVLQETMTVAVEQMSDYHRRRPLPFYPWLRQIAWQRIVDAHRRHLHAQKRSVRREEAADLALPDGSALELAGRLFARSQSSPSASLQHFKKAIELQTRLASEYPAVPGFRESLAVKHGTQAIRDAERGKQLSAIDHYRQAIAIRERQCFESPGDRQHRKELALTYENLAELLRQARRFQEAIPAFVEAIKNTDKLVEEFKEYDPYRDHLSRQYYSLGQVLQSLQRFQGAEDCFAQAIHHSERLAEKYPKQPSYRDIAANSHHFLAILQLRAAHFSAIEHWRLTLKWMPRHWPALENLAWLLTNWPDEKLRNPKEALEAAQRLVKHKRTDRSLILSAAAKYRLGKYQECITELQEARTLGTGIVHLTPAFFLAMAHYRLGDKNAARRWYAGEAARMENNKTNDTIARRLRDEAAKLLGIEKRFLMPRAVDD